MAVKQALLALLEARRGAYLSGEEAAGRLGVSRAAVWKAVRALRADGYAIDGRKQTAAIALRRRRTC